MNVFLYANVNLNLIDGSTIWVRSVAEVLSQRLGCHVLVLSREPPRGVGVISALLDLENVEVCSVDELTAAPEGALPGGRASRIEAAIEKMDADIGIDRIIIRDVETALAISRNTSLRKRLWAYVLDLPSLVGYEGRAELGELAANARGLLVQSDPQRGLLEALYPSACDKTSVLPPMVETVGPSDGRAREYRDTVSFVYSGKYSKPWNVEAYFDLPRIGRDVGVPVTVTMIGDKINDDANDPGFKQRILDKLENSEGVRWLGAMDRGDAVQVSATHDLGLCWRSSDLNDSLELSTKFLEFASVGVPSVINRTATYQELLGEDYPYFADTASEVIAAARKVNSDPALHEIVRDRCRTAAQDFTYEKAARRLRLALDLDAPRVRLGVVARPKVLIASHDLKFLSSALRQLADGQSYEFLYDRWTSLTGHDESTSISLLSQADVIFCEWCAGQAVWYSTRKLPDQKLYLRLHRMEVFTDFPKRVIADAVDGFIVVSEYFKELCIREYNWPASKIFVIPQYCVAEQFRRPKYASAPKTMGFVGINGFSHKRLDRAIEILRLVRRKAPDFRLRIRSAMPWEFKWIWRDPDERRRFQDLFREIDTDTDLRKSIIFDRAGNNMADWYRNIGFIISTSETEGCHTAVAEGICSGSFPIVINWPGSKSVYGEECVSETVEEMADAILTIDRFPDFWRGSAALQERGGREFDVSRTVAHLDHWMSPPRAEATPGR